MIRTIIAAASLLAAVASPSAAQYIPAALDKAKDELAAGQATRAYLTLSNTLGELAPKTPLFLTAAKFIQDTARGYGQYDPRPHNAFTRGEAMRVYLEPAGFDHAKEGELYQISLVCDYAVTAPDGRMVTSDRAAHEVSIASRQPNSELAIDFVLPYLDLPPGSYTLEVVVRDRVGKDSAAARLPFRIM